jgi:hypothetical protein
LSPPPFDESNRRLSDIKKGSINPPLASTLFATIGYTKNKKGSIYSDNKSTLKEFGIKDKSRMGFMSPTVERTHGHTPRFNDDDHSPSVVSKEAVTSRCSSSSNFKLHGAKKPQFKAHYVS